MNNALTLENLNQIAQIIYDKKGFNILVLDVREISNMTDYFIIAEGTVDRHVKAISHFLEDELAKVNNHPLYVEGQQDGEWVVLDYVNFVVHLFTPELRELYRLENLWKQGKIVDITINTSAPEIKKF